MNIGRQGDPLIVRLDPVSQEIRFIRAGAVQKGEPGVEGPEGAKGRVIDDYQGAWEAGTSYVVGDIVLNATPTGDGALYIAIAPSGNVRPNTDTGPSYWTLLMAPIVGPTGPAGADGSTGTDEVTYLMPNVRGDWESGETYLKSELVLLPQYPNKVYYAKSNHVSSNGNKPESGAGYWGVLIEAQRGPQGTKGNTGSAGSNGTNGSPGPAGANGANGAPGAPGSNGTDAPVESRYAWTDENGTHPCVIGEPQTWTSAVTYGDGAYAVTVNGVGVDFPMELGSGDLVRVTAGDVDGIYCVTFRGHWD